MILNANIVDLGAVETKPALIKVRQHFTEQFGKEEADKCFTENDWKRLSYVIQSILPGKSILDVGTGQGHMVNALACMNEYKRITTIDIKQSSKYRSYYAHERLEMNVTDMKFSDGEFDTVICTEVIEHLPDEKAMFAAIDELNRVAAKQLIVSIPLFEPLPLPKHHQHRFDTQRIQSIFSEYSYTVLFKSPVTRVPWLMLEKRKV